MDTIVCKQCNKEQDIKNFYGWNRPCKACSTINMREYRKRNREVYLEKAHKYYEQNKEHIKGLMKTRAVIKKVEIAAKAKVYATNHKEQIKEWIKENPGVIKKAQDKYRANHKNKSKLKSQYAIKWQVKAGKIIPPCCCSICNDSTSILHAHHPDYSKALEVIWVCPVCHKLQH